MKGKQERDRRALSGVCHELEPPTHEHHILANERNSDVSIGEPAVVLIIGEADAIVCNGDLQLRPLDTAWAPVERHAVGAYFSFETQLDERRLRLTSPAATLERLRSVKRRVDPHNVFHDNIDLAKLDGG